MSAVADKLADAIVAAAQAGEHRRVEALVRQLDAVDASRARAVLAALFPATCLECGERIGQVRGVWVSQHGHECWGRRLAGTSQVGGANRLGDPAQGARAGSLLPHLGGLITG